MHSSDFYLTIASLYHAIIFSPSELWDINSIAGKNVWIVR